MLRNGTEAIVNTSSGAGIKAFGQGSRVGRGQARRRRPDQGRRA